MTAVPHIGQRLSYDGAICTVRYAGEVAGTSGTWLGVEWDDSTRGKHDGSHKGTKYFQCRSKSPTAASFIRPSRPSEAPRSFISALYWKYASEFDHEAMVPVASKAAIEISGKVVEEVGFDKIRRQMARLGELKIVILDNTRVVSARDAAVEASVAETCPSIVELDLSHNLFVGFEPVVQVVGELPDLKSLRLNGNRYQDVLNDDSINNDGHVFAKVKDLALDETLLGWEEVCHITAKFESLANLNCGSNQLTTAPSPLPPGLTSTLTVLNLEFNEFTALSDISALSFLKSLRNLHLKGNNISAVTSTPSTPAPIFSASIRYLDLSYNQVSSWSFIDALQIAFPGLTALRLAHNPIYDNPNLSDASNSVSTSNQQPVALGTDEAHMITIARLSRLKTLNFVSITPLDRPNAEMFYLSRIAKQLAAVPEEAAPQVLAQHPRYAELCELYGAPDIIRRVELNPDFLESRLVDITFRHAAGEGRPAVARKRQIPNSFDVYAVKGIAGRLFGLSPLHLRLVWETGEWDPVAGFDEQEGDSSDEEEGVAEAEFEWAVGKLEGAAAEEASRGVVAAASAAAGRFVKREVELRDSPRALRFCVDGQKAIIRVEAM